MKRLIAGAIATAALILPSASVAADDIPPPAGTKDCPPPYVRGVIVWHDTPVTPYGEVWICIPGGP